ncbi:MAG: capsular biosynthesis protein [Magnetococcales bacterium]|nr:capsular biosynthesis protein [Magnetococcales bacterium]
MTRTSPAVDPPTGWVDIHCHILPGLDDGPGDRQLSLAMARRALESGTRVLVATPHITPGIYDNSLSRIERETARMRDDLLQHQIDLDLRCAADVRLCPELLRLATEESLPTLNRGGPRRYFLLEFPHDSIPPGSDKVVRRLLDRRYVPILTHPERNAAVLAHSEKLTPFLEMGCLCQVTAGSLAGEFGLAVQRCAIRLLEKEWIHLMASDAHDMLHRPPDLRQGVEAAARVVGLARALSMVTSVPKAILQCAAA